MRGVILVGCSGLMLAGCVTNSQPVVAGKVAKLVSVGMDRTTAAMHLRTIGFSCQPSDGGISCTRMRNYHVVSNCLQRINLRLDAASSVTAIDVPAPACPGGYE